MPTKLDPLILTELSLVDDPANKDSRVTIFKRRDNPPQNDPPRKEPAMTEAVQKNFVELAEDIRKSRDCSRTEALSLARQRYPQAFEKFQEEGLQLEKKARARPEPLDLAKAL